MCVYTNDSAGNSIPESGFFRRPHYLLGLCGLLVGAFAAHAQAPASPADETKPPPALVQKQSAAEFIRVAETALREKRPAEAVEALRGALRIDPSLADRRRLLADTLFQIGRRAEALAEYQYLLRVRADADIHERLITLLRESGNTIDALRLAQKAAQSFPTDARFTTLNVELLLQVGDAKAAREFLDRLPQDAANDLLRARTAEKLGAWAEAYRAYQRAARSAGGKLADDGRKKALGHAVKTGRWLVFAPEPWMPTAGGSFLHAALGVELKLEAASPGATIEVARNAVAAKFPRSLGAMLSGEDKMLFEAKNKEHQPGAEGHFETSSEEREYVSELLARAPVKVEAESLGLDGVGFAHAVFKAGEESYGQPVFALVTAKIPLAYVLSGKLELKAARELLQAVALAGVVEE